MGWFIIAHIFSTLMPAAQLTSIDMEVLSQPPGIPLASPTQLQGAAVLLRHGRKAIPTQVKPLSSTMTKRNGDLNALLVDNASRDTYRFSQNSLVAVFEYYGQATLLLWVGKPFWLHQRHWFVPRPHC